MPLVQTRGAASAQGFGEFAQVTAPVYIEDVFSTYLYTGNGATQTITNNIDLSTKGGLVWIKDRGSSSLSAPHGLFDTVRGVRKSIYSNTTDAQQTAPGSTDDLYGFTTSGFSVGSSYYMSINNNATNYASWTFREQPKFFDVVTYTGDGINGRAISHNLGSVPGCIMVKRTDGTSNWVVYHRSLSVPTNKALRLNTTSAELTSPYFPTTPTSTVFYTNGDGYEVNTTGQTYVAYLFAHNAGGFGLLGTDNVITCGSYTGIAYPTSLEVTIGYEPQFVIIKNATTTSGWTMWDVMRGMSVVPAVNTAQALLLEPNTSAAESDQPGIFPTATGFVVKNGLTSISSPSDTMVYIAIRRGPMKVPTLGTSVFQPIARTGTGADATVTTGINSDLITSFQRTQSAGATMYFFDKLRGKSQGIRTGVTNAEASSTALQSFGNTSYQVNFSAIFNDSGLTYVNYSLVRAPGFFDEVCSVGTSSSNQARTHNLGAVPELIFTKDRSSGATNWTVYVSSIGQNGYLNLNTTASTQTSSGVWGTTTNTATTFYCYDTGNWCASVGNNGVFYLFATCAGVSKVGSYTGTGTTQVINCGFTAGSRFVLIKRTDSTGAWYVWDSARGIVAGNDPYLLINSDAAEVTSTDYVDTANSGFEISSTAPAAINANGGTFIFLAIA